jgi:DNA-binding NarL/FixJ family response regulator
VNQTYLAASRARRTILLVEDDEHVRHNLALLLRWSREWDLVGEAGNAAQGLNLAAALHPDLVLLDRRLADEDVLDYLPQFRAVAPTPLLVVLTAEPDAAVAARALALGASACLDKLSPPLDLLQALREL